MIHCFPPVTARFLYPDELRIVFEEFEAAPALVERSRSDPFWARMSLAGFILGQAFEDE